MSRIIKASDGSPPSAPSTRAASEGPTVVTAAVFDAQEEAKRIRESAEAEGAALLARARADAERERTRWKEEALEAARAEATELVARARLERASLLDGHRAEILELGLLVARKILGREIEANGAAADVVAEALCAARRAKSVRVRLHPDDLEAVRAREAELSLRLRPDAGFELRADPEVDRGGCVVETEAGRIDGRLETQLEALRRALFDAEAQR